MDFKQVYLNLRTKVNGKVKPDYPTIEEANAWLDSNTNQDAEVKAILAAGKYDGTLDDEKKQLTQIKREITKACKRVVGENTEAAPVAVAVAESEPVAKKLEEMDFDELTEAIRESKEYTAKAEALRKTKLEEKYLANIERNKRIAEENKLLAQDMDPATRAKLGIPQPERNPVQ